MTFVRRLEEDEDPESDPDDSMRLKDVFIMLATDVVGLMLFFFTTYCLLRKFWNRLHRPSNTDPSTVAFWEENESRRNLTSQQRRAVLEAILGENFRQEVLATNKEQKVIKIKGIRTRRPSHEGDPEAACCHVKVSAAEFHETRDNKKTTDHQVKEEEGECRGGGGGVHEEALDPPTTATIPSPSIKDSTKVDEYEEAHEDSCVICPICLCDLEAGEIRVASKHCIHVFHKECILEWLDNHNDCPVCRKQMITQREIDVKVAALLSMVENTP